MSIKQVCSKVEDSLEVIETTGFVGSKGVQDIA